ncbi:MAG TPA: hypothetical protein VMZ22_08400 [Acidimicrobiales bacterium]|nr:hypothetical protein [Acidimicrobiales bacterium]
MASKKPSSFTEKVKTLFKGGNDDQSKADEDAGGGVPDVVAVEAIRDAQDSTLSGTSTPIAPSRAAAMPSSTKKAVTKKATPTKKTTSAKKAAPTKKATAQKAPAKKATAKKATAKKAAR